MAYLRAIYRDYSACCKNFSDGIEYLQSRSLVEAIQCFQLACDSVAMNHVFRNKYLSYLGLARLLSGDMDGLILCRKTAEKEQGDGDVFLNLARVEYLLESRKRCVAALDKGLEVDCFHEGLWLMRQQLGIRQRKALPFLSRNHLLNIKVGKLLRKK